ncbi:VCBS domain-containing protein, partial [Marinobacterium jannaschii]|uniref:VCBS domain-containing protein n=1 Tax=Marinobacterium jannaschii TaxID=64970 RepID=UPI000483BA65
FSYTVTDTDGLTAETTLTITLEGRNDNPVAVADTATAVEAGGVSNGTTGSNASGNVLDNDSDVDGTGESKTVTAVSFDSTAGAIGQSLTASYGALTLNSDGSYSYVIDESNAAVQALRNSTQSLTETFSYTVTDTDGLTAETTLTITLEGRNDNPVAVADTATAIEAGGVANGTTGANASGNVLDNDTDVDGTGETKTVSAVSFGTSNGTVGQSLTASYGALTLNSDGSYSYVIDESNAAVQALRNSTQSLTETFSYTVTDTDGLTAETTLTITLEGCNDNPVAVADTATAVEAGGVANGTAGSNASGNVLDNDTDVDGTGESKTVTAVSFDSTAGAIGQSLTASYGALTLNSDGSYSYVIDESNAAVQALRISGQTLTETFSYTVTDTDGLTAQATLTVTIDGRNDSPEVLDTNIDEEWSFAADYQRDISLLFSDVDAAGNGEQLSYIIEGLPAGLSYDAATGVISGQPADIGVFSVKLTAVDQSGVSISREFTLEIIAPPVETSTESSDSSNSASPAAATTNDTGTGSGDGGTETTESTEVEATESGEDQSDDSGTETVLLAEANAIVVQTVSSDGQVTVTASVDVNVSDSGEVVFSDAQQQAFDVVALSVSRITASEGSVNIEVADTRGDGAQSYSGSMADGSSLPAWVSIDAATGSITATPPEGVTELAIRVRAIDADGQVRILEIKVDLETLGEDEGEGGESSGGNETAAIGFVPLSQQLAAEADATDAYGDQLVAILTAV